MKEVEIKIKIENPDEIIKALEVKGFKFSEPIFQEDRIYIPKDEPFVPVKPGVNVLRLRKQNGKVIFTLKQSDVENHLSKLEKEVEVKDLDAFEQIILLLDFKLITQVKKNRLKCKVGDLEVCIDEVEGLGNFMEVEKMTVEDPKTVQQELVDFLVSMNIDITNQVYEGYDVLMFKQKNL